MTIFNSYVCLPEGKCRKGSTTNPWFGPNLQPPTQQQERTFARVGTEKVFALRAQGGGGWATLSPSYTGLLQISQNLEHATLSSNI